jgi:hypothetical protein
MAPAHPKEDTCGRAGTGGTTLGGTLRHFLLLAADAAVLIPADHSSPEGVASSDGEGGSKSPGSLSRFTRTGFAAVAVFEESKIKVCLCPALHSTLATYTAISAVREIAPFGGPSEAMPSPFAAKRNPADTR